jgi:hypothetical protein
MEESSYLSLPGTSWEDVSDGDREALRRLARTIDALADDPKAASPEDLALEMSNVANRILADVAGAERDLRDLISNLRTCLAVSWDMYDKIQADGTTVSQHIENLREQIQGFEADLTALRLEGETAPRDE